jgi:hypothetical protein
VNEGVPVVLGAPHSPAADALTKLSTRAFGTDGFMVPEDTAKKGSRFGFRRKA